MNQLIFLDLEAMEALERLLNEYEGTIIFVSHDRRFVEKLATKVISIENQKITYFEGSYEQFRNRKKGKNKRYLSGTKACFRNKNHRCT